jgi:hypothetical protein
MASDGGKLDSTLSQNCGILAAGGVNNMVGVEFLSENITILRTTGVGTTSIKYLSPRCTSGLRGDLL